MVINYLDCRLFLISLTWLSLTRWNGVERGCDKKKTRKVNSLRVLIGYQVIILYLDFNLNTTGKFEFHQSVDGLGGRAVDVNQTLVV